MNDFTNMFGGARVLITGGLGFIGSTLARRLVDLDAQITLVDSLIPTYGGNLRNIAGIEERVPKGTWQDIVNRLTAAFSAGRHTDGFVAAIEEVGGHLAVHFPPGSLDANELPNHLIVLDEG